MGAELATGLFAKLTGAGLARVLGLLYGPIIRRHTIDRKSKGNSSEAAARFAKAADDLRILLGNKYGKYTTSVDALFGELQRSTFPELLIGAILVGAKPDAATDLFNALHRSHLQEGDLPASELFALIETSVRAQYDLLTSDRDLLEFINQQVSEIRERLEHATSNIKLVMRDISDPQLPPQTINSIREKLCKAMEAKYRYVPIETTRGTRRHAIKKMFIEPRFSCLEYNSLAETKNKTKQNTAEQDIPAVEIPYGQFRSTFHRTVILGDPGGGKSTTIQWREIDNNSEFMLRIFKSSFVSYRFSRSRI